MYKKISSTYLVVFIILFSFIASHASINETLPSYHWSYEYIKELQSRGFCLDLLQSNLPYTRGEVAKSLMSLNQSKEKDTFDKSINRILERLLNEFNPEIQEIKNNSKKEDYIIGRLHLLNDFNKEAKDDLVYRGIYRGGIGIGLGKNLFAYTGIDFNQYDYHDPNYIGDKWRGMAAYTEQAYLNILWRRFQLKIGRDFLKWGAGQSGTLVFSNIARPLDQFYASANFGPFKFSFVTSQLDPYPTAVDDSSGLAIRRYLSGHRLDAAFFNHRLQLSVSEIIFYGGPGRVVDFTYLNPFIFYHGAHKNKSDETNVLPTLDLLVYPMKNLQFYGSLLIDDIQLEKTCPGDLEPNEIGWLVGSRWADPVGVPGMTLSGEYVRVANRTYKTPSPWETFIHRNVPLGHPLGNDFDHWQVSASQWFMGSLWLKVAYSQTRKGEGSLFTPWDEPWMDYTVEEGYSEPFPTGVVEKCREVRFSLRYYPSIHWGVEGEIHPVWRENAYHVEGKSKNETHWRVGIWFDGDFKFRM